MAMEEFNKKKNDLETQKLEAEAGFDGEKVSELEKALANLEATKHTYEDKVETAEQNASENQATQITNLGGSEDELNKRLEEKNDEIQKVEEVVVEKTAEGSVSESGPIAAPQIQEMINRAKQGLESAKEKLTKIEDIVGKFSKEWKNIPDVRKFNDAVQMCDSIVDIISPGDRSAGLAILRNPESFDLFNVDAQLRNSETSMSFPRVDHGNGLKSSEREYLPEVTQMMREKEGVVSGIRETIQMAVELREKARAIK